MGDLQADTSLWLGTRVARVLEFARTDPGWRCHGSPYLDTDHRNCACTKCREARSGTLGLDHRWTLSIYAESDVCRGTSIMAGVDAVLWKPGRFSGMYRTAASCESRICASGRTEFGSSIRSGLSYVQEAGAPLVGTSQQPEIGAVVARSRDYHRNACTAKLRATSALSETRFSTHAKAQATLMLSLVE